METSLKNEESSVSLGGRSQVAWATTSYYHTLIRPYGSGPGSCHRKPSNPQLNWWKSDKSCSSLTASSGGINKRACSCVMLPYNSVDINIAGKIL